MELAVRVGKMNSLKQGAAKTLAVAGVLGLMVVLPACSGGGFGGKATSPVSADGTNAPVGGGINISPGSEEDFQVNVGRRTFFTKGSATLDQTAMETLDKQASWLSQFPQVIVKIQGFSDDPGTGAQNVALSAKRAEAVRNYLASRGISAARMTTKGYGQERLVRADCTDSACRGQNRRVITNPQNIPAT